MQPVTVEQDSHPTRSGHIALVGRPNVGKSTLMNALIGEKLSIVTARAQTTRERIFGILTTENVQIVFVDTPGLLEPKYRLQQAMLETALSAIGDSDVVLLLLDAGRPDELPNSAVIDTLRILGRKLVVAINKTDEASSGAVRGLQDWTQARFGKSAFELSALKKEGLERLQAELISHLPESPFMYPADDLAIQSVRFFVEELIRETIFEQYEEEVPYATVARVEEFREDRRPIYIRATIFVERDSQKPIILGKGGAGIRELGKAARAKIEAFVDAQVYLDLWVKAMPNWRNKASSLKFLGYPVPRSDEDQGARGNN